MSIFLVAFDGSPQAYKALDKVSRILEEKDSIIIASVVSNGKEKAAMQEAVNEALKFLRERGQKAVAFIEEGEIAERLIRIAEELYCDTIVLGEPRKEKWYHQESVAQKITKKTRVPVIIVR
ncbi:MAG: universal stress protein [Thermoplasmata archaeon]